ncbi:hypothetical protein GW17_00033988 [Ensete ventricosum]|nr:hypothetical protein GW17_00033988 [Ensete ventricosum]
MVIARFVVAQRTACQDLQYRWIPPVWSEETRRLKSILMNELVPAQPDRPDELRRVEALGTVLVVLGVPSTSRSFVYFNSSNSGFLNPEMQGIDYLLKPYVSSDPELTVTGRTEKDEFLILARDGLWGRQYRHAG